MIVSLLLACHSLPPQPFPRVDLLLPVKPDPVGSVEFRLPTGAPAGSELRFEGWWWKVESWLDETPLPTLTPGPGSGSLYLAEVQPGLHRLTVRLSAPTNEPARVSMVRRMKGPQVGTVHLRIHGRPFLRSVALHLQKDQLIPTIETSELPEGAQLALTLYEDGRPLARWEPTAGPLAPQVYGGPRWEIGDPHLLMAVATLIDQQGIPLDEAAFRVGIRSAELQEQTLFLNGRRNPLLGLRINPWDRMEDFTRDLSAMGGNVLEMHGRIAPPDWWARTEEWGLPVVQVPRCDGGLDDQRASNEEMLRQMNAQNQRLLEDALARPSLLAWVCEGTEAERPTYCGSFQMERLKRPVFGLDLPAQPITEHPPLQSGNRWIVEVTQEGRPPDFQVLGEQFLALTGANGPGGIFLPAPGGRREEWALVVQNLSQRLGVRPWVDQPYRASARLLVSHLSEGDPVFVTATGLPASGTVADASGQASLELWYQGPATLHLPSGARPVELHPGRWEKGAWTGTPLRVDASN